MLRPFWKKEVLEIRNNMAAIGYTQRIYRSDMDTASMIVRSSRTAEDVYARLRDLFEDYPHEDDKPDVTITFEHQGIWTWRRRGYPVEVFSPIGRILRVYPNHIRMARYGRLPPAHAINDAYDLINWDIEPAPVAAMWNEKDLV